MAQSKQETDNLKKLAKATKDLDKAIKEKEKELAKEEAKLKSDAKKLDKFIQKRTKEIAKLSTSTKSTDVPSRQEELNKMMEYQKDVANAEQNKALLPKKLSNLAATKEDIKEFKEDVQKSNASSMFKLLSDKLISSSQLSKKEQSQLSNAQKLAQGTHTELPSYVQSKNATKADKKILAAEREVQRHWDLINHPDNQQQLNESKNLTKTIKTPSNESENNYIEIRASNNDPIYQNVPSQKNHSSRETKEPDYIEIISSSKTTQAPTPQEPKPQQAKEPIYADLQFKNPPSEPPSKSSQSDQTIYASINEGATKMFADHAKNRGPRANMTRPSEATSTSLIDSMKNKNPPAEHASTATKSAQSSPNAPTRNNIKQL
jgi:hypothetical protein